MHNIQENPLGVRVFQVQESTDQRVTWKPLTPEEDLREQLMEELSSLVFVPTTENLQRLEEAGVTVYLPEEQYSDYLPTVSYIFPERTTRIEVPIISLKEQPGLSSKTIENIEPGKIIAFRWSKIGSVNIKYPKSSRIAIMGAEKSKAIPDLGYYSINMYGNVSFPYLDKSSKSWGQTLIEQNGEYNYSLTYIDSFTRDEKGRGNDIALHFPNGGIILFSSALRSDFTSNKV